MPVPYSSEDLSRVFDGRVLTRGRTLVLLGAVQVSLEGAVIRAVVEDNGQRHAASVTPRSAGRRVAFAFDCSCKHSGCAHLAAASLAAFDRYPALRRAEQTNFFDRMAADAVVPERQRLAIGLATGSPPHACVVSFLLVAERSGRQEPVSPRKVMLDATRSGEARALAQLLGGGDETPTGVPAALVPEVLSLLAQTRVARWQATGKQITFGSERWFEAGSPPALPPNSAVIMGRSGPWYVDGKNGAVGPIRRRSPPASLPPRQDRHRRRAASSVPAASEPVIIERPLTPVLRLERIEFPDGSGRLQRAGRAGFHPPGPRGRGGGA